MRRLPSPWRGPILALALALLVPHAALAVGETTGRLSGTVTELDDATLEFRGVANAKITVTSPALIGGPQTVRADADGHFDVVQLPPGTYDVEVTAPGIEPIRRRVLVRQGETVPVDFAWSKALLQAEVSVITEERHLTKPDSTASGTVLGKEFQGKLATGRRYQDVALEVAAVHDVNGGGNPQVKGGMYTMNRWLVDGLDITDPVTNTFSSNLNFDSIESVEVLTGGMEAQYNSLGGVINLVTAGGSDEWHVDSSAYVNHNALSFGDHYGPNVYDQRRPFDDAEQPTAQRYIGVLSAGGPLIEHKMWMHAAFEYNYREEGTVVGPPMDVQEPPFYSHRYLGRLKWTYAPESKHRFIVSGSADPAYFYNVVNSNERVAVAEDQQNQGGFFLIGSWDYFMSQDVNTNLQLGYQYSAIDYGPQGVLSSIDEQAHPFSAANDTYDPDRPAHYNLDDGTWWYNGSDVQNDARTTLQVDPSISLRGNLAGRHDAKAGLQTRLVTHTLHYERPGSSLFLDAGGGPLEGGLCDETTGNGCFYREDVDPFDMEESGYGLGLFLQDRWAVTDRWTVIPGIRFDYGHTENTKGEVVSDLYGFGPRLGSTFDLTGDKKTIAFGFYGRANETLSLLGASYAQAGGEFRNYAWNPETDRFEFDYSYGGAGGYRLDEENHTPPHTDELLFGVRREFYENSLVTLEYTHKRISNIWDAVEVNQIWDPTGTRVVAYKDGEPHQIFLYTRPDENYRIYDGFDLIMEAKPSEAWDLYGAYTLSWLYGPGSEQMGQVYEHGGQSQFTNPRQEPYYTGFLPEDVRHQLKFFAAHSWKQGLVIGGSAVYQTGAALSKHYFNANNGGYTDLRSPQGTEPGTPNDPRSISEFRAPATLVLNTRVGYDFHEVLGQHLVVLADVFNALNLAEATSLDTNDTATFGQVRGRQSPLRIQLGARFLY